eukprot:4259684-Alexandrium_andersonii.AAC.1
MASRAGHAKLVEQLVEQQAEVDIVSAAGPGEGMVDRRRAGQSGLSCLKMKGSVKGVLAKHEAFPAE